ncbi:hypothetical protein NKH85_16235 [Mesorhizobium sp. M0924]|uniref:hypothetical protein n=1 Tax=unclassified Mesorhizobium TaxID=325217 RepID=UPI00333B5472
MVVGIVALVFWLAGFAVIATQMWGYLQTATWQPFSFIDAGRLFSDQLWFSQPNQWLGLYRILDWIPVSLVLVAMGYLIVISDD